MKNTHLFKCGLCSFERKYNDKEIRIVIDYFLFKSKKHKLCFQVKIIKLMILFDDEKKCFLLQIIQTLRIKRRT